MNRKKNDLSAITQNIFYPEKDSQVFFSQNSTHKKIGYPHDRPTLKNGTSAFIVDWQLPGMGMGDVIKSFS